MNCDFEGIGEGPRRAYVCRRCGFKTKPTGSKKIKHVCQAWPRSWEFGHWVEFALAVFGVNQRRFNALRRLCGFTKPCKCGERIAELNESGGWVADRVAVLGVLWRRMTARPELATVAEPPPPAKPKPLPTNGGMMGFGGPANAEPRSQH